MIKITYEPMIDGNNVLAKIVTMNLMSYYVLQDYNYKESNNIICKSWL